MNPQPVKFTWLSDASNEFQIEGIIYPEIIGLRHDARPKDPDEPATFEFSRAMLDGTEYSEQYFTESELSSIAVCAFYHLEIEKSDEGQ